MNDGNVGGGDVEEAIIYTSLLENDLHVVK